jgi:hypothetical protein
VAVWRAQGATEASGVSDKARDISEEPPLHKFPWRKCVVTFAVIEQGLTGWKEGTAKLPHPPHPPQNWFGLRTARPSVGQGALRELGSDPPEGVSEANEH